MVSARALTFEEDLDRALGEVREPLLVFDRGGVPTLHPGWPTEPHRAARRSPESLCAGLSARESGRSVIPLAAQNASRLHVWRDGQRHRLGGNCRSHGQGGHAGHFWRGGPSLGQVERAIGRIQHSLGDELPFGFNLIHSPSEPALESAIVDLYLRRGIRLVEASAFLDLTLPVVRYRVAGIHVTPAARSTRRTGSSPRCQESRSPPSFSLRRRSGCSPRWSSEAS